MLLEQGWLIDVHRVPSSHYGCRPDDETPILLVAHNINLSLGEFGGPQISVLFAGTTDPQAHPLFVEIAHLCVSTHCLIYRNGGIVQYVPSDKRAWHAGISQYQGHEHCNDFSIGIELKGTDMLAYTDVQYQQLTAVTRALTSRYPDITNNTTGRCDTASDRRTDPGPTFDWARFRALVSKEIT